MQDYINDIEENLEYRFLYDNDIDSINLLLSMIDLDHPSCNLQPKYVLMNKISTSIKKTLSYRKDRHYIAKALKKLINDDIHRLELAIVIKAYNLSRNDSIWVDKLERLALENYSPQELKHMAILYHDCKKGKAMAVKSGLFNWMKNETDDYIKLRRYCNVYSQKLLKKKIYMVNDNLDSQIVLDFNHLSKLKCEEGVLTIKELNHIYRKLRQYLSSNASKIYKEYVWRGINDQVLERYRF